MERTYKASKNYRILTLYARLQQGKAIQIQAAAAEFHVTTRSIQRDIADIQNFLADRFVLEAYGGTVAYEQRRGGYVLS